MINSKALDYDKETKTLYGEASSLSTVSFGRLLAVQSDRTGRKVQFVHRITNYDDRNHEIESWEYIPFYTEANVVVERLMIFND